MDYVKSTLFGLVLVCFALSAQAQIEYRLDSIVNENWASGKWTPYEVTTYVHNGGNRMMSWKLETIDSKGVREPYLQALYTYNAQNGMTEKKENQIWSNQFSAWVYTTRDVYLYANSKQVARNVANWQPSNSTWDITYIDSFYYDGNGVQLESIGYLLKNGTFAESRNYRNTYKSNGNKDSVNLFSRVGSEWVLNTMKVYHQNTAGQDTALYEYAWNSTLKTQKLSYIRRFVRNSDGDVVREERLAFGGNQVGWQVANAYDYEVNTLVKRSIVLFDDELYEDGFFKNTLTRSTFSQNQSGTFYDKSRSSYFYDSKLPNSLSNPETAEIRIYPNPCNDLIHLELSKFPEASTIRIFDLHGKQVVNQKWSESNVIQVTNLNTGVFILQVLDNDGSVVGSSKFVKN